MAKRNQPQNENILKQKEGYNTIHDMFSKAKNHQELKKVALRASQLIKDFSLDAFQAERLEQYGIQRFNEIIRSEQNTLYEITHNRR